MIADKSIVSMCHHSKSDEVSRNDAFWKSIKLENISLHTTDVRCVFFYVSATALL